MGNYYGILNANSIKGQRAELAELTSSSEQKDSRKAYNPAEILPNNFNGTIHRARTLHGGGVMVTIRKDLVEVEYHLSAGK